jgi:hypothetical protein
MYYLYLQTAELGKYFKGLFLSFSHHSCRLNGMKLFRDSRASCKEAKIMMTELLILSSNVRIENKSNKSILSHTLLLEHVCAALK